MQPQESMLEVKTRKNKLYIGIPKEVSFQENRIPLTPLSVALLVNNGHQVMLESNAGFYGAQMTAMDNATRNAGDMIKRLTLNYNRTRQANITRELIEIISGAEAL